MISDVDLRMYSGGNETMIKRRRLWVLTALWGPVNNPHGENDLIYILNKVLMRYLKYRIEICEDYCRLGKETGIIIVTL